YKHYDDFFESALSASNKGKFLKFQRFKANLRNNFDGLYSYRAKIGHISMQERTIMMLGKWSVASTTHYNYARNFLEDTYGCREIQKRLVIYIYSACVVTVLWCGIGRQCMQGSWYGCGVVS
ncbi:MAG: hypothetical protein ACKPKO_46595, partial [Candidatus Fonsibacter sp.]